MTKMATVATREWIARSAQRSVRTVRRWEKQGLLPKPVTDGVTASYGAHMLGGHRPEELDHVLVQGQSLVMFWKDGTYTWIKSQARKLERGE